MKNKVKEYFELIFYKLGFDGFKLDDGVPTTVLISFVLGKTVAWLRYNIKATFSYLPFDFSFLDTGVVIKNTKYIKIGKFVRVGAFCYIDGYGRCGLHLGDRCSIDVFSRIVVSSNFRNIGEYITIGHNVGIGSHSSIGGSGGVVIGDNTIIGPYFSAHPENHIFEESDRLIRLQGTKRSPIVIGNDCWLGAKVTVLAGVSIGDGCVIGAGSVVTKSIPPNSVALGSPAKIIKVR